MVDLIFDNKSLRKDFKVSMIKRPPVMFSSKNINVVSRYGGDGDIYEDLGGHKDITFPVECNFMCEPQKVKERFRLVKSWLNNFKDNKLIFTDDPEWFYRVVNITIDSMDVIKKRKGKFNINFTCRGYHYSLDGEFWLPIKSGTILVNKYYKAKPLIYIEGNGVIEVTINNSTFRVAVKDYVYIDSELEIVYREKTDCFNTDEGDYPVLDYGENEISFNGNIKIFEIKCRWRCE